MKELPKEKKDRWDLIPMKPLQMMAKLLSFGVGKHGIEVWKTEPIWHQQAALYRHLAAYMSGEYYDKDSGMPHLSCAMCRLSFLTALEEMNRDE